MLNLGLRLFGGSDKADPLDCKLKSALQRIGALEQEFEARLPGSCVARLAGIERRLGAVHSVEEAVQSLKNGIDFVNNKYIHLIENVVQDSREFREALEGLLDRVNKLERERTGENTARSTVDAVSTPVLAPPINAFAGGACLPRRPRVEPKPAQAVATPTTERLTGVAGLEMRLRGVIGDLTTKCKPPENLKGVEQNFAKCDELLEKGLRSHEDILCLMDICGPASPMWWCEQSKMQEFTSSPIPECMRSRMIFLLINAEYRGVVGQNMYGGALNVREILFSSGLSDASAAAYLYLLCLFSQNRGPDNGIAALSYSNNALWKYISTKPHDCLLRELAKQTLDLFESSCGSNQEYQEAQQWLQPNSSPAPLQHLVASFARR